MEIEGLLPRIKVNGSNSESDKSIS